MQSLSFVELKSAGQITGVVLTGIANEVVNPFAAAMNKFPSYFKSCDTEIYDKVLFIYLINWLSLKQYFGEVFPQGRFKGNKKYLISR